MTVCAEFAGRSWATCTRGIQGCVCGFDDLHRVARVLEVHNKWRRGDIEIDEAPCPSAVGKAIDAAIAHLRFNAELCGARRASEPTPGYAGDNNGE